MKLRALSILISFTIVCLPALAATESTSNQNEVDAAKSQKQDPLVDVLKRLRSEAEKIPTDQPRAEYLWSCIVTLDKTIYGPDSPQSIEDLNKFAECIRFLRMMKAESYTIRSMNLYQLKFDAEQDPIDARAMSYNLNKLADSYIDDYDYASADLLMDKAVATDKKGGKQGEICLPGDLLTSAMIKRIKYDHEGATACLNAAIEAHAKVYGPHPKDPALFASASKHKDIQPYKFDTAIVEFERLSQKDAQELDPTDAHAGLDLFQLADTYFCLGQEELASSLWKRARIIETIASGEKANGKSKLWPDNDQGDLADSLASVNEFKRAEQIMIRAMKAGPQNQTDNFTEGQLRLAGFYLKAKRYKEAQDEYQQVLRKYAAGGKKKYSSNAWTELAEAYDRDEKVKLAQDTYEDGVSFFTKRNDKYSLHKILGSYAGFQRSRGQLDDAEKLRKKADDALSDREAKDAKGTKGTKNPDETEDTEN